MCHSRNASTLLALYLPMTRLWLIIVLVGIEPCPVLSHHHAWWLSHQGQ
jgi:hypothetical protein